MLIELSRRELFLLESAVKHSIKATDDKLVNMDGYQESPEDTHEREAYDTCLNTYKGYKSLAVRLSNLNKEYEFRSYHDFDEGREHFIDSQYFSRDEVLKAIDMYEQAWSTGSICRYDVAHNGAMIDIEEIYEDLRP